VICVHKHRGDRVDTLADYQKRNDKKRKCALKNMYNVPIYIGITKSVNKVEEAILIGGAMNEDTKF
jgi:hypothetical protein